MNQGSDMAVFGLQNKDTDTDEMKNSQYVDILALVRHLGGSSNSRYTSVILLFILPYSYKMTNASTSQKTKSSSLPSSPWSKV